MRWIFALGSALALGALGACELITGLSDYSDGLASIDGSVPPNGDSGRLTSDTGTTSLVDGGTPDLEAAPGDDSGNEGDGYVSSCGSTDTIENCGACGNACDTVHSLGATCVAGTCVYTSCVPGWGECEADAGVNTDGCETPLTTVTACGACGAACDTTHSMGASCDGTTCSYASCNGGFVDCNAAPPDTDGCETSSATIGCASCGGTGTGCDEIHSTGGACVASDAGASSCKYSGCSSGYANCNKAPPDSNGCETPITTPANCGACGRACNTKTGTPTCNGSTCTYACSGRTHDCNAATAPNTDGCECATPACCGTGCQTTHSNGVGGNFFDCNAAGTHNGTQAQEACESFAGAGNCKSSTGCCGFDILVCLGAQPESYCGSSGGKCYCWQYANGSQTGTVQSEGSNCSASCGASGDPTWN